jgi:Protein of unknown function (DUF1360)
MTDATVTQGEDATRLSVDDPAYRPLGTYAVLTAGFLGLVGAGIGHAARRNRLPPHMALVDLALVGVASHKLSRLVATDEVTAFARAPFVEVRPGKDGDIEEEPRGQGPRRAIGELITCPSCVGQWLAAGLFLGHLWAPRTTRAVSSIFVVDAISDFLHVGYRGLKDRA